MSDTKANGSKTIVDSFLENARDIHRTVSLYLTSGFQLKGEIVDFDMEAILFKHKSVHQLIMRSAVATMFPVSGSKQSADGWWREYAPVVLDE